MNSLAGHITAGIVGSAIASAVLDSGSLTLAVLLVGLCLSFAGFQLARDSKLS